MKSIDNLDLFLNPTIKNNLPNPLKLKDMKNAVERTYSALKNNELMDVTIYEFDKNKNPLNRIEAKLANIRSFNWILKNVKIIDNEGKVLEDNLENFSYLSTYDLEKINNSEWVIEAVVENINIKRELYKKIDSIMKKELIISNLFLAFSERSCILSLSQQSETRSST